MDYRDKFGDLSTRPKCNHVGELDLNLANYTRHTLIICTRHMLVF